MKQKSIFINASGEMKSLNELTYNNLKTLVDIEEGYIVEYKSTFDSSVKKKIPQMRLLFQQSQFFCNIFYRKTKICILYAYYNLKRRTK